MFLKKDYYFFPALLLFISGLLYSCAQIGQISGGDKDSIPPKLIAAYPTLLDTNFNGKKIILEFNEYFVLKNINQEFISSPPLKYKPEFKNKKKDLVVYLKDTLKKDYTYNFQFGDAITDLNESNILSNFNYVFITGTKVDSFSIAGKLKNAFTDEVPEQAIVCIYKDNDDSIPMKQLPEYVSKIDSSGNYNVNYIKQANYKIFAIEDLNNNMLFDSREKIAFIDSLIYPARTIDVIIDSLKAGTIMHDINKPGSADTLQNDTVIINQKFKNFPKNINLYLFSEKNFKQYIADHKRMGRGKLMLKFDIPLDENYQLYPLNFSFDKNDFLLEKNRENDSLIYWLKDTLLQKTDTLQLAVQFSDIDSLNNSIITTDTLEFIYKEKKKKERKRKEEKTVKKIIYLEFKYLIEKDILDLKQDLFLQTVNPISNIDTSKIHLYTIKDTTVLDNKAQKIEKSIRISHNQIYLRFKRPVTDHIHFSIINSGPSKAFKQINEIDSTIFIFNILDKAITDNDTLNLVLHHESGFFLGLTKNYTDTLYLLRKEQALKWKDRSKRKEIKLVFNKPMIYPVNVQLITNTKGQNNFDYRKSNSMDSLFINLTANNLALKDTLEFFIKTLDYIDIKGDSIFYADSIKMVYTELSQFLSIASRPEKNELNFIFNKKLYGKLNLNTLPESKGVWYSMKKSINGDSLFYQITDKNISSTDSLKLILNYIDKIKNNIIKYSDTLVLPPKKILTIREKDLQQLNKVKQKKQTVKIYVPTDFIFSKDSFDLREYRINTDWIEDTPYRISLDSMCFTDIFEQYNQTNNYDFSTQKEDYYALLNADIMNLYKGSNITVNDSTLNDSLVVNKQFLKKNMQKIIGQGQFIFQLMDENDFVIREYVLEKDTSLSINYLSPGKYKLKLIIDRNKNGKWDTGNYMQHKQPERVLLYPKTLELKEGWESNLEWDAGKQLIKTLISN